MSKPNDLLRALRPLRKVALELEGLVDQDERTPELLYQVGSLLLGWYQAIPGWMAECKTPEAMHEALLLDLGVVLDDLLSTDLTPSPEVFPTVDPETGEPL